jgi:hypothetical protein
MSLLPNLAYAGGPDTWESCYKTGHKDGLEFPFSLNFWNSCERRVPYYKGFIDGCMDADNSRALIHSIPLLGRKGETPIHSIPLLDEWPLSFSCKKSC